MSSLLPSFDSDISSYQMSYEDYYSYFSRFVWIILVPNPVFFLLIYTLSIHSYSDRDDNRDDNRDYNRDDDGDDDGDGDDKALNILLVSFSCVNIK